MDEQESLLKNKTVALDFFFLVLVILVELVIALQQNTSPDRIMAMGLVLITLVATLIFMMRYRRIMIRANTELREQANHDVLTGVCNRGGLIRRMERWMKDPDTRCLTGIFLDLDDFKLINDLYGHPAGDAALCHTAEFLKTSFPGALIGRTGGDEFCIILKNRSSRECETDFIRTLKQQQKFTFLGKDIFFTLSAGYADYPGQAENASELMRMMDNALYAAKIDGKHRIRHYHADMEDIKREHLGFNVKNMASGMPGSILVYKAEGDEHILFANDHLVQMFECDNYEDFLEYTHESFQHIVHPEDLDRVEKCILDQIQEARQSAPDKESGFEDYVEYRILTKKGNIKWVIDMGRLVKDVHYGYIYYVFLQDVAALKNIGKGGGPWAV